jgi:hypothetical protein
MGRRPEGQGVGGDGGGEADAVGCALARTSRETNDGFSAERWTRSVALR